MNYISMTMARFGRGTGLLLFSFGLLFAGCHPAPTGSRFNVEVIPGNDVKQASVEVDLIGATEREKAFWESYSIDKYWEPGDPVRRDAEKYSLRLDNGRARALAVPDPIWNKWLNRGALYLVVIAQLPGDFKGLARDPRREVLSLDKRNWKTSNARLEIEIQERQIRVLTVERPRK